MVNQRHYHLDIVLKLLPDNCSCAEIARQAAQMKLMRKLEKQALARAAKEARKQQGKHII